MNPPLFQIQLYKNSRQCNVIGMITWNSLADVILLYFKCVCIKSICVAFSERMIFFYPFRFLSYELRHFQCELFHFEYELRKTHHLKAIENAQHHVLHITIYFAPTNGSMRSFCLWFNIRFIPSKLASLWCVDVLSLTSFNWLIVFID